MNPETLAKYLRTFGNLNRKVSRKNGLAPHKPLLLLDVCFHKTEEYIPKVAVSDILNYEVEKLKAEARSRFRVRKVKEQSDDGYYVRHALFPRVIKSLYNEQCCVCGLAARTGRCRERGEPSKTRGQGRDHPPPGTRIFYHLPLQTKILCRNTTHPV